MRLVIWIIVVHQCVKKIISQYQENFPDRLQVLISRRQLWSIWDLLVLPHVLIGRAIGVGIRLPIGDPIEPIPQISNSIDHCMDSLIPGPVYTFNSRKPLSHLNTLPYKLYPIKLFFPNNGLHLAPPFLLNWALNANLHNLTIGVILNIEFFEASPAPVVATSELEFSILMKLNPFLPKPYKDLRKNNLPFQDSPLNFSMLLQ